MAFQCHTFIRFSMNALNVTSVSKVENEKNTCNWLNTYAMLGLVPGISHVVFHLVFIEATPTWNYREKRILSGRVAQFVRVSFLYAKVVGSIPSQGTYENQPMYA